jgi:hypothetical protein
MVCTLDIYTDYLDLQQKTGQVFKQHIGVAADYIQ